MTSQILIVFILERAFFVPFFQLFFKSLNLNSSETRNDIKERESAILFTFKGLSETTIKIFIHLHFEQFFIMFKSKWLPIEF